MIRVCAVLAVLWFSFATHSIPCWAVRKAVAEHGEAAVESWARAKGISSKDIEKAKRCLK